MMEKNANKGWRKTVIEGENLEGFWCGVESSETSRVIVVGREDLVMTNFSCFD
jgi:hypothetical protein